MLIQKLLSLNLSGLKNPILTVRKCNEYPPLFMIHIIN
jgi:hypothetical protein